MGGGVFFRVMETMPPEGLSAGHLAYFRVCTATRGARPKPQHATAVQHQHHHLQPRRSRQSLSGTAQPSGLLDIHPIILTTVLISSTTPALSPSEHPPPARHLDSLCAASSRQPHQRTTVSKNECYERLNRVTTPSRSQSVRYILMPVARIADTWPARRTAPSRID